MLKKTPIKRKSTTSARSVWEAFAAKYADECRDENGLISCQCRWQCGERSDRPDLHHKIGRNSRPDLYFRKSNLVWLTRQHHEREHMLVKRVAAGNPTLYELRGL